MGVPGSALPEVVKLEFEAALTAYSQATHLRRQDMALVTTVQGAVLTIAGEKLLHLDISTTLLSVIAFFSLLMGLNNERRLGIYMQGHMQRAKEIEAELGMRFLSTADEGIRRARFLYTNSRVFPFYYLVFLMAWIVIWGFNLF